MADNCISAAVCFSPRCRIGLEGSGFWITSMSSAAACVTASSGVRLGSLFYAGEISVVSGACSEAVLGV